MGIQKIKISEKERILVSAFMREEYPEEIDFNWLMPVVEKIAAIEYINFNLSSFDGACFYDDDYKHTASGKRIFNKENTMLKSTWLAVIQFIQWYNTQLKHTI